MRRRKPRNNHFREFGEIVRELKSVGAKLKEADIVIVISYYR